MKRSMVMFISFLVLGAVAAFSPSAFARHSMRQQRIQACADKSAGDPCTYTRKGENVNGSCESARRGKLICSASSTGTSGTSGGEMAPSGTEGSESSGTSAAPPSGGVMGSPSGGVMGSPSGGAMGSPSGGTMGSPSTGGTAPGGGTTGTSPSAP